MRKILLLAGIVFISFSCNRNTTASKKGPTEDNNTPETTTNTSPNPESVSEESQDKSTEVKWMSYNEAVKAAKKEPKKIFIDVYTDWCGWCKKMDKTTLKDPKITSYLNEKFYAVKLNAESDKLVTFQGKEMTERQLSREVFKISGYPSTVYLEADQKIIQPIPGFMDVATLDKILHYIGENHYKNKSWEEFQMTYK